MPTPWKWIPTLYFTQGLPYVIVMTLSVTMYKRLGISNGDIALYTSWLYLPWVIKPFWSPFVDIIKTKRWWIVAMQLVIGAGLGAVAFLIPAPFFFQLTLAVLWLVAFSSATHDIAADGFYMIALNDGQQSFFVGIRSTFYRFAMIAGQGLLIIIAGFLEKADFLGGNLHTAWAITFGIIAGIMVLSFVYHSWALPHAEVMEEGEERKTLKGVASDFLTTFIEFFKKPQILIAIGFIFLYRLGEAFLVKLSQPFLLDGRDVGGLGLSTSEVGLTYGTVGVIALTLGGILGGILVSRQGLKFWMWPMVMAITLPNAVYLYLAMAQPDNLWIINVAVAVEQFGYGFGFTAYMLYLIYISDGKHKTAHYALCTGFMALGMMLPGMIAGELQEAVGYVNFFIVVVVCAIPTFLIIPFAKVDRGFGKKK